MRNGMLFYHRAQPLYVPGDRILPGAWGRLVLGTGPDHGRFYFEMVWEMIRRAEFPDRPSRMRAAFVFEEFQAADAFDRGRPEYVYAVTIDPGAINHRADMSLIETARAQRSFDDVAACARRYWAGEILRPDQVEVIVLGELKIADRLTGPGTKTLRE